MRNLRYIYRLTTAFIIRFKGLILMGILLGIAIFTVASLLLPILLRGETSRIGLYGRYELDKLPNSILLLLGEGLTRLDENGIPQPALAESWEIQDDGKTWVFKLNENKTWQDGKQVTSDTIQYEFSDVEIEKPDNRTIKFKLQNPFSPFASVVSKPSFRQGLLGTGDWEVEKVKLAGGYVKDLVLVDNKGNKNVYKFYPTIERTKLAYKLGQVDEIHELPDVSAFIRWKTVQISESPNYNQVVTLFFNTQDTYLSDKSLRQALVYAIHKEFFGTRALGPISPSSWVYNPQVKPYSYDTDRAKDLIDDLPKEVRDEMSIKIDTAPTLISTAEKIAKDWEALGLKTSVQVSPILPGEFQVFLTIFDLPLDPDQYSIWHSTQVNTNITKYTNPRIDKLLEDGRSTSNLDERKKIYIDFQRFLLEDLPAAFLYHPTNYTLKRK
jgi:peptide/nickel transport system substrate-binding protein